MTQQQFKRATELKKQISEIEKAIYGIDRSTVGTIGHTGYCLVKAKITETKRYFNLITQTNNSSYDTQIPYRVALEIGDILKRELKSLKEELDLL